MKVNNMENTNKLNWNGLTEQQQEFTESIINREVFTSCCELLQGEEVYFDNEYIEEEDTYKEIYQYFIVSKWLYEHLQNISACVTEYKGLYIWGRCDFNQGLDMNSELKQITKNIIK